MTAGPVASPNFESVVLENHAVRAVILPELGGRVWELTDLARDRQWIWHRHDVSLARAGRGASYDDLWAGGWEELFPNDAAGRFEGRDLPDHGEWWTTRWRVESASSNRLRMSADTEVIRTRSVKELRLEGNTLSVAYRIESREPRAFHCLFKQHLAVAITPGCRLRMPGGRVTVVDPTFGTVASDARPFDWPVGVRGDGVPADVSVVPERSNSGREFIYVADLKGGSCGVDDPAARAGIHMTFDQAVLPYVWFFLAYGGWRGCYTAVLEPCTNMPKDLTEAVHRGQSLRLEPGTAFETRVSVTLTDHSVF